jgi:GNAT superfamily N-acetyltransferase
MISITEDIQLQSVKIEDQPKLMLLLELIYPPAYKHLWMNEDCTFYLKKFYSLDQLKLELSDPKAAYYFVIYKANVVGIFRYIYDIPLEGDLNKKSTYLNRIYLSEAAQGQGVAKALCDWLETKAKRKGHTCIWLKAMDSQKQALRFYEKQGYKYSHRIQLDFDLMHPHFRGMHTLCKQLT